MGCDIHMHVEYRRKDYNKKYPEYNHFAGKLNPGRHYGVFSNLAGVRGDGPEPKGLPEDIDNLYTMADYSLYISEDGEGDDECTRKDAEKWVAEGYSKWVSEDKRRVTGPDWHSASWATADELEAALQGMNDVEEYQAILAAMRSFEQQGFDARIVFWFDN